MNYTAAIHVLKNLLRMREDDYRALLVQLVGKNSCKAMTPTELALVRTHLDKLATRMGVQTAKPPRLAASPQQLKLRAMWWALARAGAVDEPASALDCAKAVDAWAKRQCKVDSVRFATREQLNKLVEEMKRWSMRVQANIE